MAVSKGMSCYMWTTSIPTCQPPAGNLLFCSLLASCSFVWSGCAAGSVGWAGRELQKAPKNSIPSKSCCTGHCSLAGLTCGQDWCYSCFQTLILHVAPQHISAERCSSTKSPPLSPQEVLSCPFCLDCSPRAVGSGLCLWGWCQGLGQKQCCKPRRAPGAHAPPEEAEGTHWLCAGDLPLLTLPKAQIKSFCSSSIGMEQGVGSWS